MQELPILARVLVMGVFLTLMSLVTQADTLRPLDITQAAVKVILCLAHQQGMYGEMVVLTVLQFLVAPVHFWALELVVMGSLGIMVPVGARRLFLLHLVVLLDMVVGMLVSGVVETVMGRDLEDLQEAMQQVLSQIHLLCQVVRMRGLMEMYIAVAQHMVIQLGKLCLLIWMALIHLDMDPKIQQTIQLETPRIILEIIVLQIDNQIEELQRRRFLYLDI